jgi:hypothetical protein
MFGESEPKKDDEVNDVGVCREKTKRAGNYPRRVI